MLEETEKGDLLVFFKLFTGLISLYHNNWPHFNELNWTRKLDRQKLTKKSLMQVTVTKKSLMQETVTRLNEFLSLIKLTYVCENKRLNPHFIWT